MTPERFRQVRDVLHAMLERSEAERAAFLAVACDGNEALRADVDDLLAAYEDVRGSSFLETPAAELVGRRFTGGEEDSLDSTLPAGTRLGAYELGEPLGRGGMGVVYRAVRADDTYRQVVAIKVIRRGMDTAAGQRRFREERRILAGLDHPGIARLIDGGTTPEGLPYFVMEYVAGEPIDSYCDRLRLGIAARLRLFLQVCRAVHHAHGSLVVHRDLKPGNVLVTADGVPKLLDFGIARLIRPAGDPGALDPTLTALRLLTPDYASPEQIRGEPVTTATDVYSLGVLLYELLSGQRPYRSGLVHEVMAAICDEDPERPSASLARTRRPTPTGTALRSPEETSGARATTVGGLRKKLAGDLDTIVLKALRKAPAERYASVEAFADDVTRHLEGQPVRARPQTLAYRAGKFARRNRAAAAAATLAVAALLGGVVATVRQARIAEANRAQAEKRFEDVRKLAEFLMFEMHDAIADLPGATRVRKQLVERALQHLDELASEGITDPILLGEISSGYARLSDVQGQTSRANLGDRAGALASMRKAVSIQEQLVAALPANTEARAGLARRHTEIALLLPQAERGAALERAERILNTIPAADRESTMVLLAWEGCYHKRAALAGKDLQAVREARRRQKEIAETLLARDPENPTRQRDVAVACKYYGAALHALHEHAQARAYYERAVELDERLLAAEPSSTRQRLDLAFSYASMGSLLRDDGDLAGALRSYQQAQKLREDVYAADLDDEYAFASVVRGHLSVAGVLARMGDVEAALGHPREVLRLRGEREKRQPSRYGAVGRQASFHESVGDVLAQTTRAASAPSRQAAHWRSARDEYSRALALWERLAAQSPLEGDAAAAPGRLRDAIEKCTQALGGATP